MCWLHLQKSTDVQKNWMEKFAKFAKSAEYHTPNAED
jgi:hypothetical protein